MDTTVLHRTTRPQFLLSRMPFLRSPCFLLLHFSSSLRPPSAFSITAQVPLLVSEGENGYARLDGHLWCHGVRKRVHTRFLPKRQYLGQHAYSLAQASGIMYAATNHLSLVTFPRSTTPYHTSYFLSPPDSHFLAARVFTVLLSLHSTLSIFQSCVCY
ncbi:hypothetical protein MIND_00182100 [Mycena indigotica]|uniref:Uncharacterized protein n=1 Tax=Mycena indigotica TaxID=2126181 RepID=A0A8H6T7F1_9AGAR|nr:uncharacterized protein MIND_00182100 [Mycena indigotica]KAF7311722.1 hypothetical protein MIND_00182100 [Mycena indigotica]